MFKQNVFQGQVVLSPANVFTEKNCSKMKVTILLMLTHEEIYLKLCLRS